MAKKEIEIKTWLTREEMVKYLGDLAACLAQGKVVLQRGSEFLEFCPAQSMELELEGVHKKGQQKISIELSWRQVVMEPVEEPLKISSDTPPPPLQPDIIGQEAQEIALAADAPERAAATAEQAKTADATDQAPFAAVKEETGKGKGQKQPGK
ncbi:MAG: amphi-Trp domain-containing protein [Desulfarculus sp.]|nr:amphi-Trp domain-containing protein [Desulfarculus sp.]